MIKKLIEFSLRFRALVIILACVVMVYGTYVAARAKLDVFPDFVPPQVVIQTEAPGLSSEQVEAIVTRPVEGAVIGTGDLETVRSQSIHGLSIITAVFKEGTQVFTARQMLGERLSELAGQLPEGVKSPKMTPLTSATMDLLKIGLVSDTRSPMQLRTFADWTVRPRLLAVPGVAKVSAFGGDVRQLQVQVRPERLLALDLSIEEVVAAARMATGIRGAGFIETEAQRIVLQTEGQSLTPEALGEAAVTTREGTTIRLRDVAYVREAPEPKQGDALVMGRPGVLLTMSSQYGANTMEVTEAVESALEELAPAFASEGIILFPRLHRPATFIEHALRNVRSSLLLGAGFVAVVLFLFLFNIRAAIISLTAIPLSLLIAIWILDAFHASLNTITLGGLAIALGAVVDDAIIGVENIFRRLRENRRLAAPRPLFRVVLDASLEVRSAVVYATFVVALVFLPVLTMSGLQGRLFAPLGVAYILAILASLVVALTVTPALSFVLLPRAAERDEPRGMIRLKGAYRRLLEGLSRHPRSVGGAVLVICAGAAALFPFLGGEFLPEFREGHFVVQVFAAPGTSLPELTRIGSRISAEFAKSPHIDTSEQQVGRAELGEDPWGPHRSEFHVELNPGLEDEGAVQEEIRETLSKFPGIYFNVLTFLGDRIGETISGETAEVVVSVFGEDLDVIDQKSREVAREISRIPGAVDVQLGSLPGAPQLVAHLRADRLRQFGFRPVEVLDAIQTALQGTVVAQTHEANRVSDVAVILDPERRRDPEGIGALLLRSSSGIRMPVRELADLYPATGRYMVLHDGARRRQTITCNVRGRDISSFVESAKKRIASGVKFPSGTYATFGGEAEARSQAQRELFLHSAVAGVGILLLLSVVLNNARNLLLLVANLPFALVGGVLAAFFTGGSLSVGSLVGFVTLFGISTRNSIMMISHYEHLTQEEGMTWGLEAALRGAAERLVPILMTALVTALGLLPIALGSGDPGREIEGPMAVVILGGLATSTALNLLVLPVLGLRYGRFERRTDPEAA